MNEVQLIEILLKQNYLSQNDISEARNKVGDKVEAIFKYLKDTELINKNIIGLAIAESFNMGFADFDVKKITDINLNRLNEEYAKANRVVFFDEDEQSITLATDIPNNRDKLISDFTNFFPNKKIFVSFAFSEDIELAFKKYKTPLKERFARIFQVKNNVAKELVHEIVSDAIDSSVSDIHFEPFKTEVVVRYRIDGILHEVGKIDHDNYINVLNVWKVLANLRIDEHETAQDGAVQFMVDANQSVDLRISIVPTIYGEKVVIRILSEYVKGYTLDELGLSEDNKLILKTAIKKPHGMILISGPTGSGKTTTLYSLIGNVNKYELNVTTIEDPVEYKISYVNQIQVNAYTNLTFARGLRSIVRQDPNVIIVGEIRDNETAEISVNAALTGHLLLSTFHANDCMTSVPRLLDMKIEPFLLASTLNVIVAQRLVRKICTNCRISQRYNFSELTSEIFKHPEDYFTKEPVTLYRGKGCEVCNYTGYKGRIGIYEVMRISDNLRRIISSNPVALEIFRVAREEGFKTFFEDGLLKVLNGVTTLDELLRVAPVDA